MAPNRKQLHNLELPINGAGGIDGLRSTVQLQSKFLPLTDPRSADQLEKLDIESAVADAAAVQAQQQSPLQQQQASQSYWDWYTEDNADLADNEDGFDAAMMDEKKKTNAVLDLFSASHIEANLVADAKKFAAAAVAFCHKNETTCTSSVRVSIVTRPQHRPLTPATTTTTCCEDDAYWDWTVKTADYEEELAHQLTTSAHILQNLVKTQCNRFTIKADVTAHHNPYWTWETTKAGDASEAVDDDDGDHPNNKTATADQEKYWTWHATIPVTLVQS